MNEYDNDKKYAKLKKKIADALDGKPYKFVVRTQEEWAEVAKAVNQGIDSHLEGITRSSFDSNTGHCVVHADDLPVLIRRLGDSETEMSEDLRKRILAEVT